MLCVGCSRATEKALGNLKQWRWISRMLERADVPLKTVEFFWIAVAAGLGMAFARVRCSASRR